jgi:hypothetical protein
MNDIVWFNATHGVLSRYTVLPSEDRGEYGAVPSLAQNRPPQRRIFRLRNQTSSGRKRNSLHAWPPMLVSGIGFLPHGLAVPNLFDGLHIGQNGLSVVLPFNRVL